MRPLGYEKCSVRHERLRGREAASKPGQSSPVVEDDNDSAPASFLNNDIWSPGAALY